MQAYQRSLGGFCAALVLAAAGGPLAAQGVDAPATGASLHIEPEPLPAAPDDGLLPLPALDGVPLLEETPPEAMVATPQPAPARERPLAPPTPTMSTGFEVPPLPQRDPRWGGRYWSLGLGITFYYDSNLRQVPDDWAAVQAIQNPRPDPIVVMPTPKPEPVVQPGQPPPEEPVEPPEPIVIIPPYEEQPEPEGEDFVFSVAPSIDFRTPGEDWTLGFHYGPTYNAYLNNDDYNGFDHSLSATLGYRGPRLTATLGGNYGRSRGVNRYYGSSFVEQQNFGGSLSAAYRMSPKTSLDGSLTYSMSDSPSNDEGQSYGGYDSFSAGLSALWKATPLLTFGPGLRYTMQMGDTQNDRSTIGPTLRASYQVSRKVSLDATVGMDFVSYGTGAYVQSTTTTEEQRQARNNAVLKDAGLEPGEGEVVTTEAEPTPAEDDSSGNDDPFFHVSLSAGYALSSRTAATLSILRDTTADGYTAGSYRESTAIRAGLTRRIGPTSLSLGGGYQFEDWVTEAEGSSAQDNRAYWTGDASLSFPIWKDSVMGNLYYRYRFQQCDNPAYEYRGHQVGLSAIITF